MVECLTDRLDAIRSLNWEYCPGEVKCSTAKTGKIYRIQAGSPSTPVSQICKRCEFLPTKPGQEPPHLVPALQRANELAVIRAVCGRPDAFGPLSASEWECIAAWVEANNKSEGRAIARRRKEAEQRAEAAELDRQRRS